MSGPPKICILLEDTKQENYITYQYVMITIISYDSAIYLETLTTHI